MTLDELKAWGADTAAGLQRCMNNETFFFRLVKMIPGDPNFQKLYDAVAGGDLQAAFEAAHALKGSTGNLSLTPLYAPVCEITELLRAQTKTDYAPLVGRIRSARDELERICGA